MLGGIFFWQTNLMPVNPSNTKTQTFAVNKGESVKAVAQKLAEKKLIRNWLVFVLEAKRIGLTNQIQAGDFRLSPSYSMPQILKELTHGTLDEWVTIPEGLRKEEIAQRLNKQLGTSESDFLKIASEGYIFPDTYLIPKDASAAAIAKIMRDNFNRRLASINPTILLPNKKFSGLDLSEIVTLASLVERETKFANDRPIVAGILLKRLQHDWSLEVDATLQYALGYDSQEKTWWRKNLTSNNLDLKSSYNTRKYKGLPPGPISNPGLAAIRAVFYPQETPYWFYLSDKKGQMHYAKTIEEHTENIKKYL